MDGSCGCDPGTFDLDRSDPGCECQAEPAVDMGLDCASAIDLGDIPDTGQVQTVAGSARSDWWVAERVMRSRAWPRGTVG